MKTQLKVEISKISKSWGCVMKWVIPLCLFLLLVPFMQISFSEMYIWTDKNGVKRVSNVAPPQNSSGETRVKSELQSDQVVWEENTRNEAIQLTFRTYLKRLYSISSNYFFSLSC
jgi:hypothetical protein